MDKDHSLRIQFGGVSVTIARRPAAKGGEPVKTNLLAGF
nr:hypothetical protein [uncultured bacterium]